LIEMSSTEIVLIKAIAIIIASRNSLGIRLAKNKEQTQVIWSNDNS
jgi:hypothetical protein